MEFLPAIVAVLAVIAVIMEVRIVKFVVDECARPSTIALRSVRSVYGSGVIRRSSLIIVIADVPLFLGLEAMISRVKDLIRSFLNAAEDMLARPRPQRCALYVSRKPKTIDYF